MSSDSPLSSLDLWAGSKFIGRECSEINMEYVLCKKGNDYDPFACKDLAEKVMKCANTT